MPNFTTRITSGSSVAVWQDPATVTEPSRLNAFAQYPHRYWLVDPTVELVIQATVGAVEGPADGALGGELFKWSWVEQPSPSYSSPIPPTAGFSSVTTFPANHFLGHHGHYRLLCWRENGGAIAIPFEVIP
jgi:hypothetical protein